MPSATPSQPRKALSQPLPGLSQASQLQSSQSLRKKTSPTLFLRLVLEKSKNQCIRCRRVKTSSFHRCVSTTCKDGCLICGLNADAGCSGAANCSAKASFVTHKEDSMNRCFCCHLTYAGFQHGKTKCSDVSLETCFAAYSSQRALCDRANVGSRPWSTLDDFAEWLGKGNNLEKILSLVWFGTDDISN
jgi:hypothetical protein